MTTAEWEQWAADIEAKVKIGIRLALAIAGALAVAAVTMLGIWNQVSANVIDIRVAQQDVVEVKANTIANNSRLDEVNAPPPTPEAEALIEHVIQTESPAPTAQ